MAYTPQNANGQATSANSSPVVIASDQSAVSIKNVDVTSAINLVAVNNGSGGCTSIGGADTYTVQLTGTWVGTVIVQVSRDGTNFVNLTGNNVVMNVGTGAYVTGGAMTANGLYQVSVPGISSARILSTAYTSGTIAGSASLTTSTCMVGVVGTPAVTVTSGSITSSQPATPTTYSAVTTASTNVVSVKASAGTVYGVTLSNPTATPVFYKLFNKASAPTLGTDVPLVTIPVPATSATIHQFGALGLRFSTGVASAVTGAMAAADVSSGVAAVQVTATYV
jgi:hypothetical protein